MADIIRLLAMTGILPVILAMVIAFGVIGVYFMWIKKS